MLLADPTSPLQISACISFICTLKDTSLIGLFPTEDFFNIGGCLVAFGTLPYVESGDFGGIIDPTTPEPNCARRAEDCTEQRVSVVALRGAHSLLVPDVIRTRFIGRVYEDVMMYQEAVLDINSLSTTNDHRASTPFYNRQVSGEFLRHSP